VFAPNTSPEDRRLLDACAEALDQSRHAIAESLVDNACLMPRWAEQRSAQADDRDQFIAQEGHAFVDYLVEWIRSGNDTFKNLYIGEKLKQLYDEQESDDSARKDLRRRILSADRACFERHLRERVSEQAAGLFAEALEQIHEVLLAQGEKVLDVLFVGDCLYLDVMAFIAGPCMEERIELRPCFATSKNPAELGRHLRSLSDRKFDVVFYSPFSYEFDLRYAELLRPSSAFRSAKRIDGLVDESIASVESQIDLIEDLFDCPIHIHNTANILREETGFKRHVKTLLTRRTRRRASHRVDHWLQRFIEEKNSQSYQHLYLIDELALARPFDETELGTYLYRSELQHPCRFSEVLAAEYTDILSVHAHLLGKKLVVCDLDNTLWEGVIGEGAVTHYHDRQSRLRDLKTRGVVLSINSKNDPENVDFDGGTLEMSDFVYSDIDWEPKVNGIRRTEQALNLKSRDFVFIDDRADEREMSRMAFPDLVALDPCDEQTWRRFELWYALLDPALSSDRTALYQEREARREFLQHEEVSSEDSTALFQSLELRLCLREATDSDLKRVHELINRTNQFNLCGTRVNYAQVEGWSKGESSLILVADARDRFGDMGTVGILVLDREAQHWDIPVFVLSCRVFGYGIERAMLNQVKAWVQQRSDGPSLISGEYRETGRNQPCSTVYPDNGFVEQDGKWCFEGGAPLADAEWLEIESKLASS
jgi:FkbH-like protein